MDNTLISSGDIGTGLKIVASKSQISQLRSYKAEMYNINETIKSLKHQFMTTRSQLSEIKQHSHDQDEVPGKQGETAVHEALINTLQNVA